MLITVDLYPVVRQSLSCKFHLGRGCDGGGVTIHLPESACASQDSLLVAVLKERTDVDSSHHGPLSPFRFFDVETFE